MRNKQYDLRLAIAWYLNNDAVVVPSYYIDHIVSVYERGKQDWDLNKAAALVLCSACYDGVVAPTDLTYIGRRAMIWAEAYIERHGLMDDAPVDVCSHMPDHRDHK